MSANVKDLSIDQTFNKAGVLAKLREDVERLGSQKALAEAIGVHPSYVGDVLKGKTDPGPSILRFYGLREESVYVPEGTPTS
jgi:transcriptional regulator with XRE-family HTH domain